MTVSCAVAGCAKPSRTRGWCEKHYSRWKRHGDPSVVLRRTAAAGPVPRAAGLPERGLTTEATPVLTVEEATAVPATGDPAWRTRAACRTADPETFHPDKGQPVDPAKRVCAECVVVGDCREFALSLPLADDRHGVYGGLTPDGRARIRRAREAAA